MMAEPERRGIARRIVAYHADELGDWVAELDCGHGQHVRHDPPWQVREWVTTERGREWGLSLYAAIIVKYRDAKTDTAVRLEDYLR